MTRLIALSLVLFILAPAPGCASAPPNLSPQAQTAWYGTKVIKALDVIRDVAIDANAMDPPIISTSDTRVIVEWHQDAIKAVHAAQFGWQQSVSVALDVALRRVSTSTKTQIEPYVKLAQYLLKGVR